LRKRYQRFVDAAIHVIDNDIYSKNQQEVWCSASFDYFVRAECLMYQSVDNHIEW
jgi:hypothetical protein